MNLNYKTRLFDLTFSFFAILLLIIPILIISLLIKLDSKGPIIFLSKRCGKRNKIFTMPKFRTMTHGTVEVETDLFKNKNQITKIGSFLRAYSLDEILQFFSVFLGHMSVVGPRPCLPNQHKLLKLRKKYKISNLKPGITGLAQINGRDMLTLRKKILFEKNYLKKKSIAFDIKIVLITFFKIFNNRNEIKH